MSFLIFFVILQTIKQITHFYEASYDLCCRARYSFKAAY